jgi:hypothetical protein
MFSLKEFGVTLKKVIINNSEIVAKDKVLITEI